MHDDLIQGIVFSRSTVVDLRRMSRRERMIFKMLATKRSLSKFATQRKRMLHPEITPDRGHYAVVRAGAQRTEDLNTLVERLRPRI